ncbi:peptidyl-Lys metalloendopeptidase [Cytidiella melzeri]|nr:peptidyl-Lys metalloendopeptidase [Cytidiella melzeri]
MFPSALRATLVALVASAVAVSATPALTLTLSGAEKVDGVNNLKIAATVKNTGDETLKLLNDPRGVLNKLPTEAFEITHDESGASPAFTGVKYVPATAAKSGKSFTVLAPGEETTVEHDLSAAFNFTSTGPGSYSFAASTRFYYVDPETSAPVELFADHPEAHTADLSGKLAVTRPTKTKRETYNGCSSSEESSLVSAASAAQSYAAAAYTYTSTHTASTARFTTWFGTYTTSHHSTILTHYKNLNGNTYSSYSFDCTCDDSDTYAYVYPDELRFLSPLDDIFGVVYLCGAFWDAPTTGTDSKGGTLIHESSHFTANAGTEDYVYGQTAAKSLAKSDSAEAIENADNHEYYAENNPSQA